LETFTFDLGEHVHFGLVDYGCREQGSSLLVVGETLIEESQRFLNPFVPIIRIIHILIFDDILPHNPVITQIIHPFAGLLESADVLGL